MKKKMPLQYTGAVEIDGKIASIMLCADDDRPEEFMVHWWGKDIESGAALTHAVKVNDETLLQPTFIYTLDQSGGLVPPATIDEDVRYALGIRLAMKEQDGVLAGKWSDQNGQGGIFVAEQVSQCQVLATKCDSWEDFKTWIGNQRQVHDLVTFRGHGSNAFQLNTTLQRVGRHRLERYCAETLPQFRGHAEMITGLRISQRDSEDFSMLLGLAQHHGLPTPLLDFTNSPYIAAFFAFADALESISTRPEAKYIRVYGLSREFIVSHSRPVVTIPYHQPYICTLAISPRHNPRLYAQQGTFLVTNVSNLERYIVELEQRDDKKYLVAADVPIKCAPEALEDLAFMGLTAATMFPGLDGVCRMMRHEMTFRRPALPVAGKPAAGSEELAPGSVPIQSDQN